MDTSSPLEPMMGRVMSIDLGSVRVGIGLSDLSRTLASPFTTLTRESEDAGMISRILELAEQEEVAEIIVGLPRNLKIERNLAEKRALAFIEQLRRATSLPIIPVDERFTTVLAERRLRESGLNSKSMRSKVDAGAATEILQEYLDQHGKR